MDQQNVGDGFHAGVWHSSVLVGGGVPWEAAATLPPLRAAVPDLRQPAGGVDHLPAGRISGGGELGQLMVEHPQIAQISFTGSAATGKKIMATGAATLKKVTLELGGNDPAIVLPDVVKAPACQRAPAACATGLPRALPGRR